MSESDKEATLRDVLSAIDESNRWLRVLPLPSLRASLTEALKKPDERRVYQESDGRSVREGHEAAGVGFGTVVNYWKRWAKAGLVRETKTKGRYEKLVDLGDIGMEVGE